jgi:catechol 2,3-dioxygenase-like lactoylglutathione lyase family enzyme
MSSATFVHVGIAASDLDRSMSFWRDLLGLRVIEERPKLFVLTDGFHNITVFEYARGDRPANLGGHASYLHVGVRVDDLAATIDKCLAIGLNIFCDDINVCRDFDPANPPTESFKVEDPDGVVVDISASKSQWLGVTM